MILPPPPHTLSLYSACHPPNDSCLDGCAYTAEDGTEGTVCDVSCSTGEPYGTYGCSARDGEFGTNCRVCYIDMDKAMTQMNRGNTVIM